MEPPSAPAPPPLFDIVETKRSSEKCPTYWQGDEFCLESVFHCQLVVRVDLVLAPVSCATYSSCKCDGSPFGICGGCLPGAWHQAVGNVCPSETDYCSIPPSINSYSYDDFTSEFGSCRHFTSGAKVFVSAREVNDTFVRSLFCTVAVSSPPPAPSLPPAPPLLPPSLPAPPAPPPAQPPLDALKWLPPVAWIAFGLIAGAAIVFAFVKKCVEPRRHRLLNEHTRREESMDSRRQRLLNEAQARSQSTTTTTSSGEAAGATPQHGLRGGIAGIARILERARRSQRRAMARHRKAVQQQIDLVRYPPVEDWMSRGLLQVGVALPDGTCFCVPDDVETIYVEGLNDCLDGGDTGDDRFVDVSAWQAVETQEGKILRVCGFGSGFCVDERGVFLTDEHVRGLAQLWIDWAAEAGFEGGCLVFAAYTGGEIEWRHGWVARVLSYTEDWNPTHAPPFRPAAPDPHVQPLQGFSEPLSTTQRCADAAVLCAVSELASGTPVSMQPGSVLRAFGGRDAAESVALRVMPHEAALPLVGEPLWALGHPMRGGSRPMSTECRLANACVDEHGEWLQMDGRILPGHSGGPIVNASRGAVVAWIVRDTPEGITHARRIVAAQPCIEAALATLSAGLGEV